MHLVAGATDARVLADPRAAHTLLVVLRAAGAAVAQTRRDPALLLLVCHNTTQGGLNTEMTQYRVDSAHGGFNTGRTQHS